MLLSIWDDAYGISVPTAFHITKGNLSTILRGFQRAPGQGEGFDIYTVRGWDYPVLCETYLNAAEIVRHEHVPAIIHVAELTQPQGHSTSGSHERYKSSQRLAWEKEHDCLVRMRRWMEESGIAEGSQLDALEAEDWRSVVASRQQAWEAYREPFDRERERVLELLGRMAGESSRGEQIRGVRSRLEKRANALVRDMEAAAQEALVETRGEELPSKRELSEWRRERQLAGRRRFGSHLLSESAASALRVEEVAPMVSEDAAKVAGHEVLNAFFDSALALYPELVIFGEDVGRLGDVNQGLAGLQEKHGELRVSDTGIREATILGQAIGLAMRGLRPIAEIQYLDYLLYALQIMSDDLASLHWRTRGGQKAPVIVRTRGHRLEGIWHSGSPMAGIIHLLRGLHVCVPRDMVQAAGCYNTLLRSDDPGLVIEVLNGYRLRERLPANIADVTLPLGVPEVLRQGGDVTLVTYGACCRIALEAAALLASAGVELEVIDIQTLLPFDRQGRIVVSLEKTTRVVFLDEDVPGGASAFMLQQVLENQGGYQWLDSPPRTVTATPHRPAYGSDGDYFSKPNREEIFTAVWALMHDSTRAATP